MVWTGVVVQHQCLQGSWWCSERMDVFSMEVLGSSDRAIAGYLGPALFYISHQRLSWRCLLANPYSLRPPKPLAAFAYIFLSRSCTGFSRAGDVNHKYELAYG